MISDAKREIEYFENQKKCKHINIKLKRQVDLGNFKQSFSIQCLNCDYPFLIRDQGMEAGVITTINDAVENRIFTNGDGFTSNNINSNLSKFEQEAKDLKNRTWECKKCGQLYISCVEDKYQECNSCEKEGIALENSEDEKLTYINDDDIDELEKKVKEIEREWNKKNE